MRAFVHGIQSACGAGKTYRRGPVCCSDAQVVGVEKTRSGIAGKANSGPELKDMRLLRPGEIIQQVVNGHLEIATVGDALIHPEERVPGLVGITYDAEALAGESPVKRISERGAEHGGVAEGKAFAVIGSGLFGRIARQERGSRVAQILQRAAPEDGVAAIGGETVIDAGNENIVIQSGGSPENEASIVQTITGGSIVGYGPTGAEGPIEITGVIG